MVVHRSFRPRALATLGLLVAVSCSGCASLGNSVDSLFGVASADSKPSITSAPTVPNAPASSHVVQASATQPAPQIPNFEVRIVASSGKPIEARLPLAETTHIQTVLEQSGALDRFRRMNIELWRPLPEGHHKLDIQFDRAKRQVPPSFDYAIHPGDKLVITEDTSNVVDDVLDSMPLPFARVR